MTICGISSLNFVQRLRDFAQVLVKVHPMRHRQEAQGVVRRPFAFLDSPYLPLGQTGNVRLLEPLRCPESRDRLSVAAVVAGSRRHCPCSPLRVNGGANAVEIQMNVAFRPVDVATVFVDFKNAALPCGNRLQSWHPVEGDFVSVESARNDEEAVIRDARVRN